MTMGQSPVEGQLMVACDVGKKASDLEMMSFGHYLLGMGSVRRELAILSVVAVGALSFVRVLGTSIHLQVSRLSFEWYPFLCYVVSHAQLERLSPWRPFG